MTGSGKMDALLRMFFPDEVEPLGNGRYRHTIGSTQSASRATIPACPACGGEVASFKIDAKSGEPLRFVHPPCGESILLAGLKVTGDERETEITGTVLDLKSEREAQ